MVKRYSIPNEQLFFPLHQSSYQPPFPGTVYTNFPAGSTTVQSSNSESEFSPPETLADGSNSPLHSPHTTTPEDGGVGGRPFLKLVEPPVESYKFRYPSETKGTQGSMYGISSLTNKKSQKKTFPSVKLCNYTPRTPDEKVFIRCTLTTADENEECRLPHVHQLKRKGKACRRQHKTVENEEIEDPIDIVVSSPGYLATFDKLTIWYIKKAERLQELLNKKKRHIEKMFTNDYRSQENILPNTDEEQLLTEANNEIMGMDYNRLNTACLKFEALRVREDSGQVLYQPIPNCQAIYSKPIKNNKSPHYNELRICKISKVAGTCLGNEEVLIFVEKVDKRDIKVRFFELNANQEEVWMKYAEMTEEDVHYQFGIAFRTPRYKDITINENVLVYFQLERPSDKSKSDPRGFEYTQNSCSERWEELLRKRPRLGSSPIPVTVNELSSPSTSNSTYTSTWYPGEPSSRDAFLSPVPGLSSDLSDSSSDSGFQESDELMRDVVLSPPFDTILDVEVEGTSVLILPHSSQPHEGLPLPNGYPERNPQTFRDSGSQEEYSLVSYDVSQQLGSQVTSSDSLLTDGGCSRKIFKPPMESTVKVAESQMAVVENLDEAMQKLSIVHEGLGGRELIIQNRKPLTLHNIVSKVNKIVNRILELKKNYRIREQDMKQYLLDIFATGIGENYDCVLHVLAAKEKFPPELQTFLSILKMYDIVKTVVNLRNNIGQTTLHVAAERGSLQTISLLVELGANVNARDKNLDTPVHVVAKRKTNDAFHAIGHILEKSPDLRIYNKDGLTALHLFVKNRKSDIISSLILKQDEANFQVDIINEGERTQGNTPLHIAVQKRFKEIVSLLVNFDHRIDVNVKNFVDKTPLAYVSGDNDPEALEIEELLLANNADPLLVRGSKMLEEIDEMHDSSSEDEDEELEDTDENLPSYALDWNSGLLALKRLPPL